MKAARSGHNVYIYTVTQVEAFDVASSASATCSNSAISRVKSRIFKGTKRL
jgi:hypothetical protein